MSSKRSKEPRQHSPLKNVSKPLPDLPTEPSNSTSSSVATSESSASPAQGTREMGKLMWLNSKKEVIAVSERPQGCDWINKIGQGGKLQSSPGQVPQLVHFESQVAQVETLHPPEVYSSSSQHTRLQPSRVHAASAVPRTLKGRNLPGTSAPKGTPARITIDAKGTLVRKNSTSRSEINSDREVLYAATPGGHHAAANLSSGSVESFQNFQVVRRRGRPWAHSFARPLVRQISATSNLRKPPVVVELCN